MKKILFLQNGSSEYAISRIDRLFESNGFEIENFWAAQNRFPQNTDAYSGVFLTGSPHGAYEDIDWIHEEHRLIQDLAYAGVPMFGVCFGHQILASALFGREYVFRRETCEVGFKSIDLFCPNKGDELLAGFQDRVKMFVWHNDEVKAGHPDMIILGSTDLCPVQIFRHRNLPVWGIQGHPELTKESALKSFEINRDRFIKDGANPEELKSSADDCLEAKQFFYNFFAVCEQYQPSNKSIVNSPENNI